MVKLNRFVHRVSDAIHTQNQYRQLPLFRPEFIAIGCQVYETRSIATLTAARFFPEPLTRHLSTFCYITKKVLTERSPLAN
jgi:hypothetical protein